jgi:L-lactate dehydrogenase complex protein LldG
MSGRDDIMASIRAHAPRLERPEPLIPLFDDDAPKNLLEAFSEALERMGGELLKPEANDPLAPVRDKISGAKVVCSHAPEIAGTNASRRG